MILEGMYENAKVILWRMLDESVSVGIEGQLYSFSACP